MTILPAFLVAFPRIYTVAFLMVSLGIAARLVPQIERHPWAFRRVLRVGAPAAMGIFFILAISPSVSGWLKQANERARPFARPGSSSVLLIVLDTVAAGHLSLYGYERPTSTTLIELAEHGIRFDAATANASWTLPSHATMFTGRWLHELSVGWLTPLDRAHRTLAEFLGTHGYATAGFIANTSYCASDSGLGRGFTVYEDYIFPGLTALKIAVLGNRSLKAIAPIIPFVEARPGLAGWHPPLQRLWRLARSTTASGRLRSIGSCWTGSPGGRSRERPFFAFLNYADAHTPYELPPGRLHRFGVARPDERQREMISRWADLDKAAPGPDRPAARGQRV